MSKRKIKGDKIFDGYRFLEDHVLVAGEDGMIEDLVTISEAGSDLEFFEGIIAPGLINCHCHLELSHMKGLIPEKTGLVDFVFKVVTERHHSDEEIKTAIADAEDEMISKGIIAVGDICNNILTMPQKQKRRLQYYNFIEASGWLPAVARTRFERAKLIYDQYINNEKVNIPYSLSTINGKPRTLNSSIVPHAPYSVSAELWKLIRPYFENRVVSIHNQETAFEDEFFLRGTGDFNRMYEMMGIDNTHHRPTKKSSFQSNFEQLEHAGSLLLVHNTFTKQEDLDYLQLQLSIVNRPLSIAFCLCVNANLYIENALPPLEMFRKNNCEIVLGTDSLASNRSLSIVDEIKTIRKNFPAIPLAELLRWATINGARALQMDDELGSFEKGKKPGIIVLKESGNNFEVERIADGWT